MPRKAEFIFPPKRCEWPILSSLIIHEAFFEVPLRVFRYITDVEAEQRRKLTCCFQGGAARIIGKVRDFSQLSWPPRVYGKAMTIRRQYSVGIIPGRPRTLAGMFWMVMSCQNRKNGRITVPNAEIGEQSETHENEAATRNLTCESQAIQISPHQG